MKGRKIQMGGGMAKKMTKTRQLSRKWEIRMKITYGLCLRPEQSLFLDTWPDYGLMT